MAQILILQEAPGPLQALRKSLGLRHDLSFATTTNCALEILQNRQVDLIVARVHLEHGSLFEFIKTVKGDPQLCDVPFICFCGIRTLRAKSLDSCLAKVATVLGADKYIILDHFCEAEKCDFERLATEIEDCLPRTGAK
ncbi:MAG: hypothetical protein JSS86_14705 [Cyanobacteria bacterium SZAS LIN-2]|nr:hypothetical protein [Cyanobacteria bacterium SZAS LIN-2]MBS2009880.1 hypothetical protein [Cyanobacteria bacterium SZAS TMP-1]